MSKDPNPRAPDDDSWIQGKWWLTRKILLFLAYKTPRCNEVVRLLSEGMDHPLPLWMRIKLWAHHSICCYCHRYERQLNDLRRYAQAFPVETGDKTLSPDAKARIRRALEKKPEA
jgi:hypothetical protein